MTTRLLVIAAALGVTACATVPTPTAQLEKATSVLPAGEVRSDRGIVAINMDKGFIGAACANHVLVDNTQVASIVPGQRVEFGADPGERIVTVSSCRGRNQGSASAEVTVVAGQTKTLRVGTNANWEYFIEPAVPGF